MANQEYPIFALHRGATLLGDVMMPKFTRDATAPSKSGTSTLTLSDLFERLDAWFWRKRQSAQEAYLAQSADVFEVERRMRALERGVGSVYI
jgi:Protein of unknown function (DUF3563)